MFKQRLAVLVLSFTLFQAVPAAELKIGDLPQDTVWYLHVNLQELRATEAGRNLNQWLKWEVYDEIDEELGIDLNEEVNQFTAFSGSDNGTVIVVDGPLSKSSQEKLLAIIASEDKVDPKEYKGHTYYHVGDKEDPDRSNSEPFDDLEDTAFFSFSLGQRAIVTASEEHMRELLDNGGKIAGSGSHDGALFVISADKSFVQAGLHTDAISGNVNDEWDSNILRNTKQAALLVSDRAGMIAVEARLESTDPKMAQAIGGIINGLIALQAFNSELGPEFQGLIENTKVVVNDAILSINTVIDPDLVVSILND